MASGLAAAGVRLRLKRLGLASVDERLEAGVRLDFEDGVRLFACPDLLALGWLANRERERRHGKRRVLQLQYPPGGDQRLCRQRLLLVRAAQAW